jgi:hypothetical protein
MYILKFLNLTLLAFKTEDEKSFTAYYGDNIFDLAFGTSLYW